MRPMTAPLTPLSNCATIEESVAVRERQQCGAHRLGGKADQQQRLAAALLGMIADPWRERRHHELRHDNDARHPDRG